jgi:hypothetical protein
MRPTSLVAANRWLGTLRLTLAGLPLILVAGMLSGCDRPCHDLAEQLCAASRSDSACDAWRERTARVTDATCAAALQRLTRTSR